MATITFHANVLGAGYSTNPSGIAHAAGSGLGFYGNGYGISVPVGQYQDTTWVTNANGTAVDQYQLNNTKYSSISGVSFNGGAEIQNRNMPNYYAPLNVRFSHATPVRVQNCRLRIFDRNDITKQASGVLTKVYEVRHPNGSTSEVGLTHRGEAGHDWKEFDPADNMIDVLFTSSPGVSGLNTTAGEALAASSFGFTNWTTQEGAAHSSTRHDWYCALSSSPDSIGSKLYGLYFTLEYL
jgi:hypothetical protein